MFPFLNFVKAICVLTTLFSFTAQAGGGGGGGGYTAEELEVMAKEKFRDFKEDECDKKWKKETLNKISPLREWLKNWLPESTLEENCKIDWTAFKAECKISGTGEGFLVKNIKIEQQCFERRTKGLRDIEARDRKAYRMKTLKDCMRESYSSIEILGGNDDNIKCKSEPKSISFPVRAPTVPAAPIK